MDRLSYKIDFIFILFIIVGFVAYYIGYASMYLWITLLILRLVLCNRVEVGFFALLYGTSLFGRMFVSPSLYLWSMIVAICLGVILLQKEIVYGIKKNPQSYIFLSIVLFFFCFFYVLGPNTDYAVDKITRILVRSPLWLAAFLSFVYSKNISCKRMAVIFALLAMFYLSQTYVLYGIHPSSITDITFFRVQAEIIGRNELGTMVVGWHTMGFLALAPVLFILSESSLNKKTIYWVLVAICSFWVILSGARQTIVCIAVLFILRYFMSKGDLFVSSNILKILFWIVVVFLSTKFAESFFFTQTIGGVNSDNIGSALNRDVDTPFKVLSINPIFGIGFGGYPLYANKDYPHNFFIEMICETGVVGLLILSLICFIYWNTNANRKYFRYLTNSGCYLFLFLVLRFMVANISGDAGSSLSFICIFFAFVPKVNLKRLLPKLVIVRLLCLLKNGRCPKILCQREKMRKSIRCNFP